MTLFENVQKMAAEQGMSLLELNDRAGLGKFSIYNWRKNEPNLANLQKVARVLNTNVSELTSTKKLDASIIDNSLKIIANNRKQLSQIIGIYPYGSNPSNAKIEDPNRDVDVNQSSNYQLRVPLIKSKIKGDYLFDKVNVVNFVDLTFNHKPDGLLFMFKIDDDSAQPTIPKGSFLTINLNTKLKDGDIGAVLVDRKIKIGRVKFIKKIPCIIPNNIRYSPFALSEKDIVLGKVIHFEANL